jgi:hypothetical protein
MECAAFLTLQKSGLIINTKSIGITDPEGPKIIPTLNLSADENNYIC